MDNMGKYYKECGAEMSEGSCPGCDEGCLKVAGMGTGEVHQGVGNPGHVELEVSGMVCHSCERVIQRALDKLDGVLGIKISYASGTAAVDYDSKKLSEKDIILAVGKSGYKARVMDAAYKKRQRIKNIAVIGVLSIIVLIVLNTSNSIVVDPVVLSGASLGVVFIFGLLTGFHCLGMCGGFVISYSARLQGRYNPLPHLAYNAGRVITYSFLGLIVGFLGSLAAINYGTQGVLIILASFVMVLLGLNLLGVLTVFRGIGSLKNPLGPFVANASKGNRGPLVLGLLNGLVPCGMVYIILFTYVPFAGSAVQGAISMVVFGLGTIPLMFIYGSAVAKLSSLLSKNFVKYSGVIVLVLALVMLNRGIALANMPVQRGGGLASEPLPTTEYQEITMRVRGNSFVPNKFTVEAGKPVKWTIIGEQVTSCSNEVIQSDWGVDVSLKTGETKEVFFTPEKPGKYTFSCWMAMIFGEINVV